MAMHKKAFTVDVDEKVSDDFSVQVDERGYKKYRAIQAAVKLWTDLPPEIQIRLLDLSLNADGLVEIVNQILDERIQAGRKMGKYIAARQDKKPPQKGRG